MSREVLVRDASGRILYAAVVCANINGAIVMSRPIAVFAHNQLEARQEVGKRLNARRVYHYTEVAIAPAIGFHAHDDNGDSCSFGATNQNGHMARDVNQKREGFSSLAN